MHEDAWLEFEVSGQQQSRVQGDDRGRVWASRGEAGICPHAEAGTGRQEPYHSSKLLPTTFALLQCHTCSGCPNFPATLLSSVRFLCSGSKRLHGFSTPSPFPPIIPTKPLVKTLALKRKIISISIHLINYSEQCLSGFAP